MVLRLYLWMTDQEALKVFATSEARCITLPWRLLRCGVPATATHTSVF